MIQYSHEQQKQEQEGSCSLQSLSALLIRAFRAQKHICTQCEYSRRRIFFLKRDENAVRSSNRRLPTQPKNDYDTMFLGFAGIGLIGPAEPRCLISAFLPCC
jgi:hypothetical protein